VVAAGFLKKKREGHEKTRGEGDKKRVMKRRRKKGITERGKRRK